MHDEFQSTQWSEVINAGRNSSPESRQALESLCRVYWFPLYAYARRRVPTVDEAQDVTQAFFADFLEKNSVASARPERGKFRAFLLASFKNFLSKYWEKKRTLKRGGGQTVLSLNFELADSQLRIEPTGGLTPDQLYDQQWVIALLGQILNRLKDEAEQNGKSDQFRELKGFIVGDHQESTYAQVAERLDMTEAAAKKSASRMRKRYRELLREEIARTVLGPEEVEDEIHNLFAVLNL
ncbi:hypothetical protein KOR42_46490 [Thalassoglobus neptunius]|uniref:RNA polymerase sigma-70 region 2 domain-containing protein n=1 Tax=Thalassoglobus neptunius TaxID=1938619 RepID=A0A5C5VW90_9PLAN|nr:sigma factor [Thalassoglobus neptunius]TWT42794.1 hypothetical protein KOR42_46490 [Thalassoglobus neptunius]